MYAKVQSLIESLSTILIGKNEIIHYIVATLLAGGNILLEDMPGVGKTIVSKALSRLISSDKRKTIAFSRIQATPDLLPYDITGVDVYDTEKKKFVFKPGPIFTDILLADELNRTTPKVQSALLEAMAEKQVTIGSKTYKLPDIFFVIATQNPVETEGTYPLPAAQLDRFTCCLKIGYPDADHELEILIKGKSENRFPNLTPVINDSEILKLRETISKIEIDKKLLEVIVKVCHLTRSHRDIRLGLSPRSALMMTDMLRAFAYLKKRDFVTDQDLLDLSQSVWAHRIIMLNPQVKAADIVERITRDEIRKVIRR